MVRKALPKRNSIFALVDEWSDLRREGLHAGVTSPIVEAESKLALARKIAVLTG